MVMALLQVNASKIYKLLIGTHVVLKSSFGWCWALVFGINAVIKVDNPLINAHGFHTF